MARFDDEWCGALGAAANQSTLPGELDRLLYVVTDTEEGKVAFHLVADEGAVAAGPGKFPRGVKADVTVTAKESVLIGLWSGDRTRDEAFMAGDLKVEGDYSTWLNHVVPAFGSEPWAQAWAAAQ